jgi:ADP-ribosyl-[dinitrogen reductase] hydrolase
MALCLADSLIEKGGYDSYDVMDKYLAWYLHGYRSSTGVCFDIGNQVSTSLNDYMRTGSSVVPVDAERTSSAGNGSIMRLAPVIIAAHAGGLTLEAAMDLARISARETHFAAEAEEGTALFGVLLYNAFSAETKQDVFAYGDHDQDEVFAKLAAAVAGASGQSAETINPTGYIVNSLVAAVWAFMTTESFEEGALAAVNLGGDADTIGAIYGQLAGAYYGYEAIPEAWRRDVFQEQDIVQLADRLAARTDCPVLVTRFDEDGDKYYRRYEVEAYKGDITKLKADAIINAANTGLAGGAGVCGAIFATAGHADMTAACQKIGHCDYGEAVITPGFNLPARHVIHTVGPRYGQHDGNDADILSSCYWESLRLAEAHKLHSVAFPLISTGIYGYPFQEAVTIAVESVREYFEDNPRTSIEKVVLCGFSDEDYSLIEAQLQKSQ